MGKLNGCVAFVTGACAGYLGHPFAKEPFSLVVGAELSCPPLWN